MYRAPSELTPSPQPLSPSSVYSHNTSPPYHVAQAVPERPQTRQPMISPTQHYSDTNAGGGNNTPLRMDINNYNAFGQQTHQQHQHFQGSSFGAPGGRWEPKFNPAPGNDLRNLQSDNPYTYHNPLSPASAPEAPGPGQNNTWNLASNQFQPYHLQYPPQQYPSNPPQSEGVATSKNGSVSNAAGAAPNANCVSNTNHTEHGLSNLLTIDSEQLVRINSEDQQMLGLNSEDLQISNLSIST